MTPPTTTPPTPTGAAKLKSGQPTLFLLAVGLGMLSLFLVGFITQIQTNEAFLLHQGDVSVFQPDWSVLIQIPALLVPGLLPPFGSSEAVAIIVSWSIELVYLGFIVGYELLHHSVHQASGERMARLFRTLSWVLIAINCYTDYQYGTIGSGILGHAAFAACVSLIVGYFGTIGLTLVKHAWEKA